MWPHFVNLVHRSVHLFLSGQGTTGLGFMSPYVVSVASFFITGLLILPFRERDAMRRHWVQNIGIALGGALLGNVLWYLPLVGVAVVKTIYDDHEALITKIRELNVEIKALKSEPGRPLEIISFSSIGEISIENSGSNSIFVMDLLMNVREPKSSMSYQLNLDIEPGAIAKKELRGEPGDVRTIPDLAKKWAEHYEKAVTLCQACGLNLAFFSPSDSQFQQIKRFYSERGQNLVFDNVLGILHYRVKGSRETKSQKIAAVVIAMINSKCP